MYYDLGSSLTALAKVMRLFASHSLCCVIRAERIFLKEKKKERGIVLVNLQFWVLRLRCS